MRGESAPRIRSKERIRNEHARIHDEPRRGRVINHCLHVRVYAGAFQMPHAGACVKIRCKYLSPECKFLVCKFGANSVLMDLRRVRISLRFGNEPIRFVS